ncbi:carbonic anhydrase [Andreprevotia chitinilytica]|uniref:carbonic anhydrase n=1 Tax=Andreprevotia chitinilytica TaxID=396808 RepID=UPI00054E6EBC|nr:carbonic anhydrase family protein [Andreprevotia chitinilytica]
MKLKSIILLIALASGFAAATDAPHAAHWTYSGEEGPAHWGAISKDFHTCEAGRAESPINIFKAKKAPDSFSRIQFHYAAMPLDLLNTGHAMQFVAEPGKDSVTLGDTSYQLVQFHFHSPGEERFAGKASPLDVHLVHADANGKMLVVAVQFKVGKQANPALQTLLAHMPAKVNEHTHIDDILVDPSGLLPEQRGYYTYSGSLTTPPCSEGVTWIELKQPVSISKAQLQAMRKFYYHNQRPVQPLNGREIIEVD